MRIGSYEVGYPHLLAVALFATILLGAGVGTTMSATTYGAYNPEWDGASGVRAIATETQTDTAVIYTTSDYADVDEGRSVAFIISPERSYSSSEADRIRSFVRNGGTVVVADDFRPNSNDLLAQLGAAARVNGTPLRDERHNFRSGALPVTTRTLPSRYTTGVEQVTLNRPTTVTPNNSTILVRSSNFSYHDTDRDGEIDDNETLRSHPVVTVEQIGAGDVVVVSDPSLFINSMLERPDNRAFVRAVIDRHGTVLLDYSHVDERPPLRVALYFVRRSAPLQFLVGTMSLGLLLLVSNRSWFQ